MRLFEPFFKKNGQERRFDFANEFPEYRSVLDVEKFRRSFERRNFSLNGAAGPIYEFAGRLIFKILEVVERFFRARIYFHSNDSWVSFDEQNLLNQLMAAGVVKKFGRDITCGIYHDEPLLHNYAVRMGNVLDHSDAKKQVCNYAGGASLDDKRQAFLRTVGEAAERFCLDCYREKDLVVAAYAELGDKAINPLSFVSLSERQKAQKNLKIDENTVFCWVKGYSLQTGRPYFIPAQLVYVAYSPAVQKEPVIRVPISTGAAAGLSLEWAVYGGLCEAVERDAFMINYLNKISPPRLDVNSIKNEKVRNIVGVLKRYKLEFHFLDITTDIPVPTILAVIIDRSGIGPPVNVGTCANLDIFKAIEGAAMEAIRIRLSCRRLFERNPADLKIAPAEIFNFDNRKLFWRDPGLIKQLDFLLEGPFRKVCEKGDGDDRGGDFHQRSNQVLDYLNKVGVESFVVDITAPPVKKAGFFVVKIIAPKLQPLYLNENFRYLDGERLYRVPVKMGWRKESIKEEELNSLPHPFI